MSRKKSITVTGDNKNSIPVKLTDSGNLISIQTGEVIDPVSALKNSDIYITSAETNTITNLAAGVAIPTYFKKSWDYLKDVQDFKDVPDNDIYKHIDVCNKLYRFEPVIGTAIDLLVDFAISNLTVKTDNEKLNGIIEFLYENLNKFPSNSDYLFPYPASLKAFIKEIASEWFISGNVYPYQEYYNRNIQGENYSIPLKTLNLNPLAIRIERNPDRLGTVRLFYSNSGYYTTSNDGNNGSTININNSSPSYSASDLMSLVNGSEKALDHKLVYHIKRKYSGYKLWGIPYLTKTFTAVKTKRKLRYLDDATVDGLVNFLIIFKIGSPDKDSPYHKVSSSRIAAFEALVKNPQASNMIVWPHDIEIITAGPDGKVLDFKERYEVVDRDIIRSLGIPPLLLDGSGGTAMNWLPILSLVERLEDVREGIADYIRHLVTDIADKNNLEYNNINVKWSPSNLRDEQTIKTLLLAFYDRGLLPIETTLEQGNYDFKEVLELKKKEKSSKMSDIFARPDVPFSPVAKSPESKPNKSEPNNNFSRPGDNGRPSDNTKANKVIKGTLVENINIEFDNLYNEIKDNHKYDSKLEDKILAYFMKMKNISDVYINMEKSSLRNEFGNFETTYNKWRLSYLDSIMDKMKLELNTNLAYLRKESVAGYVTAGVFSVTKDKMKEYSEDVLDLISILDNINTKIKNGIEYAFIILDNKEAKKVELKNIISNLPIDTIKSLKIKFIEEF